MASERITTKTLEIWEVDGVVHDTVLPGAEMTLADGKEGNEIMWRIGGGVKRPRFCDYTGIRSQTSECRRYYAGEADR
jgi:hypothetical protein